MISSQFSVRSSQFSVVSTQWSVLSCQFAVVSSQWSETRDLGLKNRDLKRLQKIVWLSGTLGTKRRKWEVRRTEGGIAPSRTWTGHLRGARAQGRRKAPAFAECRQHNSDDAFLSSSLVHEAFLA